MQKFVISAAVYAALSISTAHATGIPGVGGPSDLDQAVHTAQQAQAQLAEQMKPVLVDANTQLLTAIDVTQVQQLQTLQAIKAGLAAQAHPAP